MYKRVVRLEASDFKSGKHIFTTVEHRISFEMESGLAQGLTRARIQIYNLSRKEIKNITRADTEAISVSDGKENRELEKVRVKLYAGYQDEIENGKKPPLILEGFIMNSAVVKRIPENITYLYVIASGSELLINPFDSFSTHKFGETPEWSVKDVIIKLCTSAKYDLEGINFDSAPIEVMNKKVPGHTFNNEAGGLMVALDKAARTFFFEWGVRANGIGIYPIMKDSKVDSSEFNVLQKNGKGKIIDPTKVRGTPMHGLATIEIPHNLDATLHPGLVIDVGDLKGIIDYTQVGKTVYFSDDIWEYAIFQYYMIRKVIHRGDNYGTDWQSTISCMIPSSGVTGNKEIKE